MNTEKLRRAFEKSDFDADGYLNEFETNHFGYLLFGHKNHGELYQEMCKYCGSNPLFGLTFDDILQLFPVNCNVAAVANKKKKRNKKKKKRKKKRKKKKEKKEEEKEEIKEEEKEKEKEKEEEEYDDLDVDNWADLPLSDDNEKEKEAENNLNHIRHISAFVMSGLKDSDISDIDMDIDDNHNNNKDEIFKLAMEISQWKDKFNELEQNKTNISDRYKKLEKEFINLENENNVKIKQVELERIAFEENKLFSDQENESKMSELRESNSKLNAEISQMTQNMDNLNELCVGYNQSIGGYKRRLSELAKLSSMEREELSHKINESAQLNTEWKHKYNQINKEMNRYKLKMECYEKQLLEFNEMDITYKKMESELNEFKKLLKKGSHSNVENVSKISVLSTKIEQLQCELSDEKANNLNHIESVNKKNLQQIKKIKIEYESKISKCHLKIDQLKEEIIANQQQQQQQEKEKEKEDEEAFDFNFFATSNNDNNNDNNLNDDDNDFDIAQFTANYGINEQEQEQNENAKEKEKEKEKQELQDFDEDENENENEQINISAMRDISDKQKFLLMKARMASNM